jgi:hypothetical protein
MKSAPPHVEDLQFWELQIGCAFYTPQYRYQTQVLQLLNQARLVNYLRLINRKGFTLWVNDEWRRVF